MHEAHEAHEAGSKRVKTLRSPASRIRVGEIELIAGCGRVKIPWMDTSDTPIS